jgi:hypothetical protein
MLMSVFMGVPDQKFEAVAQDQQVFFSSRPIMPGALPETPGSNLNVTIAFAIGFGLTPLPGSLRFMLQMLSQLTWNG